MVFLLFFFNDPMYPMHIYQPSFMTFALTEFTSALFISGLLIFWLREIAGFKPKKADPKWSCIKKAIFASQGVNECAVAYLCILFLIMVVNFMVLNCFYYIYVKGDPSLYGRFDINSDENMDIFLAPIIVTLCLLVWYYSQYAMSLSMGCLRLRDDKVAKARKVGFVTGVIVHFFFIFCALFGVFNRHFGNGGFQLFAYTVLNLYVYLLVILNWPIKVYFREFDLKDDE